LKKPDLLPRFIGCPLASKSIYELDRKKFIQIVGPRSHKEKNSEWKKHMVPVLDKVGDIIWVKNEFEALYK
jgi:hypothetical protein